MNFKERILGRVASAAKLAVLLLSASALALDGKWTPQQVLELDPAWLKEQGLALKPEQLWNAEKGRGLLSAAVLISGCSGALVSKTGLVLTNHHCLFSLIQEHSSPENDLITKGFLARSRSEELGGKSTRVELPLRFSDVTQAVLSSVPIGVRGEARLRAIRAKQRNLEIQCLTENPGRKCRVAVFDDGVQYTLIESQEFADVRLVYAPPRSVGEFGGELDNWQWPRHTGDFAIARVYVAPKDGGEPAPLAADFHFPIAREGIVEKDFLMILGYPGVTYRALLSEEMQERRAQFFPRREELFGQWIELLESTTVSDPAAAIAVAANVKGIANRYKNAQGQIAGLDRGSIVAKQLAHDEQVAAYAHKTSLHRGALAARTALQAVLQERLQVWERSFLLNLIPMGNESLPGAIPPLPKALYFGATLAHWAREQTMPDLQRANNFIAADLPVLKDRLRREQQNYASAADQAIFAALVERALALSAEQRIASIDARFSGQNPEQIRASIATMYSSELLNPDQREAWLGKSEAELRALKDPLLDFGLDFNQDVRAQRQRELGWNARSAEARPVWRKAVAAYAGKPIAPDANGTLRLSFAHVQGYQPRDGMYYEPFTFGAGLLEKMQSHNGRADSPYQLSSDLVKALNGSQKNQRFVDSQSRVPVNFLADGDTSGGNSGSPVLNARGELVGVNFDRVWENVAGDFGFNPSLSRNVSVDVRYLLWNLEHIARAQELLRELGIR